MLLEKIKSLCCQRNITVSHLEKILSFGNGTMHKWSNAQPSADKVLKVAKYFGVSLDYLLDGKEILSKESMDVAMQFQKFSEEQKNLIRQTLINSNI
ncbi:MAG: helix-turn-helix domain-containing protein [Anaerotignaceae bacterium]